MQGKKLDIDRYLQKGELPLCVVPASQRKMGENDFTFIPHYHSFQELVVIVSGHGIQNINGVEYPVSAGDVFLLKGRDSHYFVSGSNTLSMYNILYDPDRLPIPWDHFRSISGYNMVFRVEPAFRSKFNAVNLIHLESGALAELAKKIRFLSALLLADREGWEAESLLLFQEIILAVSRSYSHSRKTNERREGTGERINKVISILEKNYTRNYTIAELAALVHTSPRNFSRLFRKVAGESPISYLLHLRLAKAAELLADTLASCSKIGERTGFPDSNYFSRKFREQYGLSPHSYRKYHNERYTRKQGKP